eukprot:GEZU01002051.1.p1 GENE.GEZU01002051.1~~GEZU01002051.1.p1  ORF type:complete len:560 (-),score=192.23 GEZU01002051.1:61-1740(-)
MCGIFAIFGSTELTNGDLRRKALACSRLLRHRGPDWSGIYAIDNNVLCHERLAIIDLENGAQPLFNEDRTISLTVNGEIYNHIQLREELEKDGKHAFRTRSDCEVILHLYEEHGPEKALNLLSGDFAFALYDANKKTFLAARDPIGVVPLYIGYHKDGSIWFASELKSLKDDCERFESFLPGHYYIGEITDSGKIRGRTERYWKPEWLMHPENIPTAPADLDKLREALEEATIKRMMSDVPYGVLLSGGLDSSLIASIASRHAERRVEEKERTRAWWPRLHSFCIGLKGAPDLIAAKAVADFLGTVHHEFHFTVQEGIDALPDVIYHLETYDVTTIRASTPMYFLARRIKAMGVKMVLSGEGSDEVFGGYLYFHRAPNAEEFHKETVRRVANLHKFDCLRANKSTSAWGLEVRVPFLDKDFLDVAMTVDPAGKLCSKDKIEKHLIRSAFDTKDKPYLPESVLWRQKEQFSDGVGYSWIDGLKEYAEMEISDEELAKAAEVFPFDTPTTKEAYLYRRIFESKFPERSAAETVSHWVPTWGAHTDPSGRVQAVHAQAIVKE